MNSNVAGLSQAYHMLFVAALIFLAVMVMLCLIRAIIGPKIAEDVYKRQAIHSLAGREPVGKRLP